MGHIGIIRSVTFSPDGKRIATGSDDGSTRLWEAATGKYLGSLLSFRDGTWAVIDPEGRCDASDKGEVAGLHWVVNNQPIALSQLRDRFYDPGLFAKLMGVGQAPSPSCLLVESQNDLRNQNR